MTIRVAIAHNTSYSFDRRVNLSAHTIRLRPAPHCRTPIHSYSLNIEPKDHFINWQQDPYGNFLARIVFPEKCRKLEVKVEVIADMTVINPFDFFVEEYAEKFPFKYSKQLEKELQPYLEKINCGKVFDKFLTAFEDKCAFKTTKVTINDFLVALNQHVEQAIKYLVRLEPGVQSPQETLYKKQGSCRDSAWLLVQMFRHLGIAARFASGYLVQLSADEKSIDGPSGPEEDFTDLHAWCEVFIPGAGWIGLDPTSGLFASEGHIPLACTPHPVSAAPISGATDECEVEFDFSNTVTRIHEDPRVTKPYSDDEWDSINALGQSLDREFEKNDVRLTMGGEPTFVSIDDMESAQWNTEALGTEKLALAKDLILRLRDQFGPKGILHYGQGKWYPGEEIPRWALGLFWRKDNQTLWNETRLLARIDQDYGHDVNCASRFARNLCAHLYLSKDYAQPAYEDALLYLIEQQRLPKNIDLLAQKVGDDLGRRRLAKLIEKGFEQPTGFVIPLEPSSGDYTWRSSLWPMKRERIVLVQGDSPMGLRLPLNDLPVVDKQYERLPIERDTFDPRDDLPVKDESTLKNTGTGTQAAANDEPQEISVVRKALCVEARDGKIHLFMPPLTHLEEYIELLDSIEGVAKALDFPVVIEGYEPPRDPRIQKLLVTPDPGVIEVNIQPSNNWQELVDITNVIYEQAKQSRLGAEKFMLDGRHTGTGGGNHMTLGGASPADSPLLRRPDLLRSFVSYWQHHPSLSYLFSGAFIGPTSQAPRVDEGRDESLYELEIAFQQLDQLDAAMPWHTDRLFRNLLIDITGNTHRAEFCIDKLYSPDGPAGRLGIVELRGFEMPPHPRMSLVQALLIRCLLARFWKDPYKKPLVRWGTALHDKYMLPYFVWEDMKDVVEDLQEHGYDFKAQWLRAFEEFRFPHFGRVNVGDAEIELRWAIEPWHVLGEESGSFGTARYVDSSIERVQVKVSGLTDGRYVLACNGRRVPLVNIGAHGEYLGAVRYKAWAPPSSLHPTIGAHAPLVFDLIDTWNDRSIGGCTYHVSHPGGRSYDTFPVNPLEAESRRGNRFDDLSHSQRDIDSLTQNKPHETIFQHSLSPSSNPGSSYNDRANTVVPPMADSGASREFVKADYTKKAMLPPQEEAPGEYPHTLDLRRAPRFI